jgi:hypothetical protein
MKFHHPKFQKPQAMEFDCTGLLIYYITQKSFAGKFLNKKTLMNTGTHSNWLPF